MSVLPRNIVVDISTCRKKNAFAQQLFRIFTENIKTCHLTVNCMLLVAIVFLKARSCSTKIMVGQNSLISCSICIRE